MPDIAMCLNEKCEKKEQCYRYTAEPCEYQCYAGFDENNTEYCFIYDAHESLMLDI